MNDATILWEEKNSTERSKKLENKLIFVLSDGINETKNVSVKNECEDIGNKKEWKKNCPRCGKKQFYSTKSHLLRAIKHNRVCLDCVHLLNRIKHNYIGKKFGSLTITNQYYLDGKGVLKVDYTCDCGYKSINKSFWRIKRQKMCVLCKKKNKFKILPNGETSFNSLYSTYIKSARNRSLKFELTKENFRELTKQKCFYCGDLPNTIIRPKSIGGGYTYNGIDRKDSGVGYVIENCVPCCKVCNYFKLKLSVDDFLNHIKKIYEYKKL